MRAIKANHEDLLILQPLIMLVNGKSFCQLAKHDTENFPNEPFPGLSLEPL